MADVTTSPEFVAGRDRGEAWAKETLAAEGADAKQALRAEAIEAALGTDRGETAHGFLKGVNDVLMGLPPYARPNVVIEVANAAPAASVPRQRRSFFGRVRSAAYGDDD